MRSYVDHGKDMSYPETVVPEGAMTSLPDGGVAIEFLSLATDRTLTGVFCDERGPDRGYWAEGRKWGNVWRWTYVR